MELTVDKVREVMKEVGVARIDDLAEHLGYHPSTVRRKLDAMVYRGEITKSPGQRGRKGPDEYKYGDGSPEQE